MAEKLLPCPFCGSEAEIERQGDHRQSTIYQCTSCSCSLETSEEWDHGRRWNTRATPDRSDDALAEEVKRALSDPATVHINMLRGAIAKPSIPNIVHLYGRDALLSYLMEDAR